MKYKILSWLANKAGYNLEPSNRLAYVITGKNPTVISSNLIQFEDGSRKYLSIDNLMLQKGDTLRFYITE